MTEPERMLRGLGDDVEVALLRSAQRDAPSSDAVQRTLLALGVGSGVTAATATASSAGLASASAAVVASATVVGGVEVSSATVAAASAAGVSGATISPAAAPAAITLSVKWIGVAGVVGLLGWGAATQLSPADGTSATQATNVEAAASEPSSEPVDHAGPATVGAEPSAPPAAAPPAAAPPAAALAATAPAAAAVATVATASKASPTTGPARRLPGEPSARTPAAQHSAKSGDRAKTLGDEVAALDAARQQLEDDPDGALAALDDYAKGFQGGVLAQEAEILRVEALARAGHDDRARAAARAFVAKHPGSPLAARARAILR